MERPNPRIPCAETPTPPGGASLTKQSHAVGQETWEIVERYHTSGMLEAWNRRQPSFGDFSDIGDYQTCLNRVLEAQEAFDALPAAIRDHCGNDPAGFLEMVLDPARRAELEGLGLVPPQPAGLTVSSSAADQPEPDGTLPILDKKSAE